MENLALFVGSCDKYQSAWYPFFELLKIYWPAHPNKIYLSSETKKYSVEGLNIISINSDSVLPWSQRMIEALQKIDEEYIIFLLEDFFLLGSVKQKRIEECLEWMKNDSSIGECRLSTFETVRGEAYENSDFVFCPQNHPFRIDTQVAIWRKDFLISLFVSYETPWQFEENASLRSINRTEKLLWFSPQNPQDLTQMIFPYYNDFESGYGIGWGKWRPKNKAWFLKNGIMNVKFGALGVMTDKDVIRRRKYLYCTPTTLIGKLIKKTYQAWVYSDRIIRELLLTGPQGIRNLFCMLQSKKTNKKKR